MNKNFIAILLFAFTAYPYISSAQLNNLRIGIEGSPSLTCLYGNDILSKFHKPSLGYTGGLALQYYVGEHLAIRTGLGFERKGSKVNGTSVDVNGNVVGNFTSQLNYNYAVLPLLVRICGGKKFQYFANAGPYFGVLLKSRIVNTFTTTAKTISVNTDMYKRTDAGLASGIGIGYAIKQTFTLSMEIRNNLGLSNISALPVINNGAVKTISTNCLVGLAFQLDR